MDSNVGKSKNGSSSHGRVRGVILSPQGWQQFQAAKQQAESEETWGKHFTQEYLSDRTGLSLNTLYWADSNKSQLNQAFVNFQQTTDWFGTVI